MIRLRAGKGDLDCCTLFYGDRACTSSPVQFASVGMEKRYEDELYDFYEIMLADCPRRICYYFLLEKGSEKIYYYADSFHQGMPDIITEDGFVIEGRSEYYQYPYILRSKVVKLPEWYTDAIVYNIFPDSFADGRRSLSGREQTLTSENGMVSRNRLGAPFAAFLYLCMAPGVPSVFYGDEKRGAGIREAEYRSGMPWTQSCAAEMEFVQSVIAVRKE